MQFQQYTSAQNYMYHLLGISLIFIRLLLEFHSVFCNGMQEATVHKGIYFYGNSLNSRLFLVELFAEKNKTLFLKLTKQDICSFPVCPF